MVKELYSITTTTSHITKLRQPAATEESTAMTNAKSISMLAAVAINVCWFFFNWSGASLRNMVNTAATTSQRDVDITTKIINNTTTTNKKTSGRLLVERAYQQSFQKIVEACPDNRGFKDCIVAQHKYLLTNQTDSWPWWYHTMIRDSHPKHGLFGYWHNLTVAEPHLHMCTIEKIGTKHWRAFQCHLNEPNNTKRNLPCQVKPPREKNLAIPAARTVFLRDPLERFLSGFLDKCQRYRQKEPHCEPLAIFQQKEDTPVLQNLIQNKRKFFEAYVDAIPLKWNMHFFPLSFYCDGLYRHLDNYDFVGMMGPTFYADIDRLRTQYREQNERIDWVVNQVFDLDKNLNQTEKKSVGVEMVASSHVLEYYSPSTVRRVLQYMSIDYHLLGLPIPDWAQQMLDSDEGGEIFNG